MNTEHESFENESGEIESIEHESIDSQELAAADQVFAELSGCVSSDRNSEGDEATVRLGAAIKLAAKIDSPQPNSALRGALMERLGEVQVRPAKPSATVRSRRSNAAWLLAASVCLALASASWFGWQQWFESERQSIAQPLSVQKPKLSKAPLIGPSPKKDDQLERLGQQQSRQNSLHDPTAVEAPPVMMPQLSEALEAVTDDVAKVRAQLESAKRDDSAQMMYRLKQFDSYGMTTRSRVVMPDQSGATINESLNYLQLNDGTNTTIQMNADQQALYFKAFGRAGNRGFDEATPLYSEQYSASVENDFVGVVGLDALSTFSIDVDTASYANVRRFIRSGRRPPAAAVRIEELINYFDYDYPQPTGDAPFSVNMELADCPWNRANKLLRIGLQGKDIDRRERPASNLVFLLDVSGSMRDANKLPLMKRGLLMMMDQLTENDRVSIVTYAGNAGLVLPPTSGDQKSKIRAAIDTLAASGSTHGSEGINLAYQLAAENFLIGGTNRVIWATDGDLNVGVTQDDALVDMVRDKASDGVFLTVLGFGTGNLKDGKLEKIADNGNGLYAYIDSMREAHKVLVEQMSGSLVTIAKDVKLQIEFNPVEVKAYRLIGYENRVLAAKDFDDDAKDAGEIGAGHCVTALYELVTQGSVGAIPQEEFDLKYQKSVAPEKDADERALGLTEAAQSGDLLTLALRYKAPEANESTRIEYNKIDRTGAFEEASSDLRFAASVAAYGMILSNSKHRASATLEDVESMASAAIGDDTSGYRAEFIDLVRQTKR